MDTGATASTASAPSVPAKAVDDSVAIAGDSDAEHAGEVDGLDSEDDVGAKTSGKKTKARVQRGRGKAKRASRVVGDDENSGVGSGDDDDACGGDDKEQATAPKNKPAVRKGKAAGAKVAPSAGVGDPGGAFTVLRHTTRFISLGYSSTMCLQFT